MPQQYSYHWEIRDLLTQFLQAFDGAIVKRHDSSRNSDSIVGVRYVYAPKQRVLHDLVNKAQHITLPVVAFWITSINRDVSRVFNKIEGQYRAINGSTSGKYLQPVPVNIEVSVSILARFQSDMDQILSNFVPYNDPYFIISWQRDGMDGIEIRTEVLWSGANAMGYPIEQEATQPTRVTCDTNFTIKGWLFKADSDPVGRIFKIDTNFYPVSGTPTFENYDEISDSSSVEAFVLSAVPVVAYSNRWLATQGVSGYAEIFGDMYNYTSAVYLSAANPAMFGTTSIVAPYTATNMVNRYPPLSGVVAALSYDIVSTNKMFVSYPAPSATGNFDIIVVNDAGYTKLTTGSYNANYNIQLPYSSGINVS